MQRFLKIININRFERACTVAIIILMLSGCNTVQFHEKEQLNDRLLQFDSDSLSAVMRQHMITPREGAIGGFSPVGAGGCSCK